MHLGVKKNAMSRVLENHKDSAESRTLLPEANVTLPRYRGLKCVIGEFFRTGRKYKKGLPDCSSAVFSGGTARLR